MKIRKILNNNFVIVGNQSEKIIMGLGIGYKKRTGDLVEKNLVDKTFQLADSELSEKFIELLPSVSVEVVHIVDEIVEDTKIIKLAALSDGIYLSLIDHIQSALQLHKEGKSISNALLWDIQHLYNEEYQIGEIAIRKLNDVFNVDLPQDEAGFIALHIVNASLSESSSAYETTKLIKAVLTIIKYHFSIVLDEKTMSYNRLVTHLRFFARRVLSRDNKVGISYESLFENTKNEFPEAYECTLTIKGYIEKQYKYVMSKDELLYLMIHIERAVKAIKQDIKKKGT